MWIAHAIIAFSCLQLAASLYCEPNNCYELLEVSPQASAEEIKKAFRLMAKRHHPDRNKLEDTTSLFQQINLAYQILDNEYTRRAYDHFLRDPSGSRAYHTYQYYKASYSPQTNPFLVVFIFILLLSLLQWVMRKQMYNSAFESILNSQSFKKRVNEECINDGKKGDKKYKEEVTERLQQQISIEGGYSKPNVYDLLVFQILLLPYTIAKNVWAWMRWIWKYWICRQSYQPNDQEYLTKKALRINKSAQWESMPKEYKEELIKKELWVKANMRQYQQQMQQMQLEEIKRTNPAKYRKIMAYLKKNT